MLRLLVRTYTHPYSSSQRTLVELAKRHVTRAGHSHELSPEQCLDLEKRLQGFSARILTTSIVPKAINLALSERR